MTQQTEPSTVWLTQDAYDKLKAELEHLKGPVRQEIVGRISSAREEGDHPPEAPGRHLHPDHLPG